MNRDGFGTWCALMFVCGLAGLGIGIVAALVEGIIALVRIF